MPDFPPAPVTPLFISSLSEWSIGRDVRRQGDNTATGTSAFTWTANQATFVPLYLPWPYLVNRVWWMNGSTLTTSNADLGIYTLGGGRIYSTGSTAMSGASAPQYVAPTTPFMLPAGLYLMAWACDNTTSRAYGYVTAGANVMRLGGAFTQTSAFPLPSPATVAAYATIASLPVFGITRTASGF